MKADQKMPRAASAGPPPATPGAAPSVPAGERRGSGGPLAGRLRDLRDPILRLGLAAFSPAAATLEFQILGRVLLHAAAIGLVAGVIGGGFFAALEFGQRWFLDGLAGFETLRSPGETFLRTPASLAPFRPWLLALLPAFGGLVSGLLTRFGAPEAAGGGGNAAIRAYHQGGIVRRRVIPVKALAAIFCLSTGGAGGREGPTMQIGAGLGALVGRWLPTSRRERRVLLVAGIAAGMAAVFRTPLGAALLATEMLYRDDFEAEALIPAILASVVAYAVVISAYGQTTLFGVLPRFPFRPGQLALYALLALPISLGAVLFVSLLRAVEHAAARSRVPAWLRPAAGGLAMGVIGVGTALAAGAALGPVGRSLAPFGGGYGVASAAISGASFLPHGWSLVGLFAALALVKMLAAAFTIGSGGAAGDFAPSLVTGGLLGAAFGHAARLLLHDPSIDPAAFAIVGMGTFYGGAAHAPLSALVLVSELSGSYDLLVPMMLATGIAFVALRRWSLYDAQPVRRGLAAGLDGEVDGAAVDDGAAPASAPAGEGGPRVPVPGAELGALAARPVAELVVAAELPPFHEGALVGELLRAARDADLQRVVIVTGSAGEPRGLVDLAAVEGLGAAERGWTRAVDAMVPFTSVGPAAAVSDAAEALARSGLPQLPVVADGRVIGWIGERELVATLRRG